MKRLRKKLGISEPSLTRGQLRLELKPYATKEFVENKINELARATEKAFQKTATKDDLRASEKRIKKGILVEIDKRRAEDKKEILDGIKTQMEVRDEELQGKHEIELDQVEGKKDAPLQWKSIPRRLKTVEVEVEKIKDHLEIA